MIGEIGGTVGDIESLPFLEAIRQFRWELGRDNVLYIHLTLVPYIAAGGRGQDEADAAQREGADRAGYPAGHPALSDRSGSRARSIKNKIAHFCNVDENAVITARDVDCIYELPLLFHSQGLDERVIERLGIWTGAPELGKWERVVHAVRNPRESVRIAVIGKYVDLTDSYKSLNEALFHGGIANECKVGLDFVDSETDRAAGASPRGAACGWHPGADGLWPAWNGGEDRSRTLRA